jgi:VWFA-related protein
MITRITPPLLILAASLSWNGAVTIGVQEQPRFRTAVEAVVLDVSVLGRDGMPVRGMTAADFTVLEDGKPQAIANFTPIDLPDVDRGVPVWLRDAPLDAATNDEIGEGALLVIVMDDIAMVAMPGQAQDCARQVIESMGPHDLAAVVFVANKRLGQEFTHDRSRLLAAVERYRGGGGTALVDLAPRMLVDTLGDLADGLAALPARRKAIVYVSTGLHLDFAAVMPDSLAWTDVLGGHDTGSTVNRVLRLFDRARRANVSVYCVNPRGLSVDDLRVEQQFLRTLSQNTGGFTVTDTNDPRAGVVQIFRENSSYYVIGYQPANARTEARFRKIEVRVNRPGATVRTRSGYFEPGRERAAAPKMPLDALGAAMSGFLPKADVSMRVTAAPFAVAKGKRAAVAVVVGLRPGREPADDAGAGGAAAEADVDLLVNAYNMMGDLKGTERLHARLRPRPAVAGRDSYEVFSRLDLDPGRYHLRLAANIGGRTGSVLHDIDVPDFTDSALSLSGVALTATPAVPSAPKDRFLALIPVVPTARRQFEASDGVSALLRVYQGGRRALAPVAVRARVLDARSTAVFDSVRTLAATLFDRGRAADYHLDLPLANLQPGPYLLILEATMGKSQERRDVRFSMLEKR